MPARAVRWWIVDTFTGDGRGGRVQVSGERFTKVMRKLDVKASVALPDRLGPDKLRRYELSFERPRNFRVVDVVEAVDALRRLRDAAGTLAKDTSTTLQTALKHVRAIVGDGELARALDPEAAAPEPEPDPQPEPEPAPAPEPAPQAAPEPAADAAPPPAKPKSDDPLDAIFGQADLPTETKSVVTEAKTGIDAYVGAVLKGSRRFKSSGDKRRLPAAQQIQAAVDAVACEILAHPEIAELERAWRGLRMVMGASPGHDEVSVSLVDVVADDPASGLEAHWPTSEKEQPDAIFVGAPCYSVSMLAELAAFAQKHNRTVVVGVTTEVVGPLAAAEEEADLAEAWEGTATLPGAGYVCAVANPGLLANEDTKVGPRVVTGGPAIALAALVTAAIERNAPLPNITGPARAFVAPAAHDVELRPGEVRTIPTEAFASPALQQTAAKARLALLGSPVGSDRILVVAAPTLDGSSSLMARIRDRAG